MNEADDLLFDADLAPAKAVEPPKRWRNVWIARVPHTSECDVCRAIFVFEPGDEMRSHCLSYPDRDVAEAHAMLLDERFGSDAPLYRDYVGAFPVEGDAP